MKYEEMYCAKAGRTFTISEIAYIFNNDPERFACDFEGEMYCPDCRKVPMSYVNAQRPHFRGFPNVDHEEGCIYTKEEMTPEEVRNLLTKSAGETEIVHQIDRLVVQFLRNSAGKMAPEDKKRPASTGKDSDTPAKKRWQMKTVIPRKQINAPFCDEDYGVAKLFYGRVHIKWEETQVSNKMKLLIQQINTRKLICRLFLTASVYRHLPYNYKSEPEYDAFAVFMTTLEKKDKNKSWSQGNLIKSTLLSINKLRNSAAK